MPASGIDVYFQEARNNFDAVRPAPIPIDASVSLGQCQNIHISTNCYYGYHDPKTYNGQSNISTDCEMEEVTDKTPTPTRQHTVAAKKRSADDADIPQSKRLRQEVQRENIEPETSENMNVETNEELLESLYWNTHGGNLFHLIQCP